MSIDTVSSRPDAPTAPLALAAPPLTDPPAPDLPLPAPQSAAAARLQARRLRAVHDLADRIARIEQDLQAQAQALERSRAGTRDHLRELQQRSASLTTELLRGQARTARQDREQAEERRRLEARVAAQLKELESSLAPLQQALQGCTTELAALRDQQATLERLNTHLDRLVLRQGRALDLVTAEFRQQMDLLRATQDTLREELAAQQTALLSLTLDHEQASLHLERLRSAHDNFTARTETRLQRLAQQQRVFASLLAALALLSLTLIAWCYTHPVTVPPAARQQLQQLAAAAQRQDELSQAQALVLAGHDLRLTEQQAALELAREHNELLRADARRQQREVMRLRRQLATLEASLAAQALAAQMPAAPAKVTATAALH
jgi:DNA repair exonuclease SbcCD ATPase subunit